MSNHRVSKVTSLSRLQRRAWGRQRFLVAAGLSLSALGCSAAPEGDESVGEDAENVYVVTGRQLFNDTFTADVCFFFGTPSDRAAIREGIESWEAVGGLDFYGWADCPASPDPAQIPIWIRDVSLDDFQTASAVLGKGLRHPWTQSQIIMDLGPSRRWLRTIAAHEVGHAVGMIHEHQRPDRDVAANCFTGVSNANGDLDLREGGYMASDYDYDSIMNYCRDFDHNGLKEMLDEPANDFLFQPSPLDVVGFQELYGPSPALRSTDTAWVYARGVTGTVTPPRSQSYNSMGGINTITKLTPGAGRYEVSLPRVQSFFGGNVQVTALSSVARHCKVESWLNFGDRLSVTVLCFDAAGNPADSDFSAYYVSRNGQPGIEGGYAWAEDPTNPSYSPNSTYAWNSTGQGITITRRPVGQYTVTFSGQNLQSATPIVTAYGSGANYCKIVSMGTSSVDVNCFTAGGSLADTRFSVAYSQGSLEGAPSYSAAFADQPAPSTSYAPARQRTFHRQIYGGTDAAGRVTVQRTTTSTPGSYRATFSGFRGPATVEMTDLEAATRSNLQVTSVGSGAEYCTLGTPSTNTTSTLAQVNCFNPNGTRADSRFSISLASLKVANQPRWVAQAADAPSLQVAVDGNVVYYGEVGSPGDVRRARADGGVTYSTDFAQVVMAGAQVLPARVAANANSIFWINAHATVGSIVQEDKATQSLLTLWTTPYGAPTVIQASSTHVYFGYFGTTSGNIVRVPVNGGTAQTLAPTNSAPTGLALDASTAYFTTASGSVRKVPLGGGTATQLVSSESSPESLVVSGSSLYWLNTGNGRLRRVGTGGGTVTTLASGIGWPRGLAVDTTYAYFADASKGTIQRLTLSDNSIKTLASGLNAPYVVGMDPSTTGYVYFGTGDSALMKVVKQP